MHFASAGERFLVTPRDDGERHIESLTQKMRDFLKGGAKLTLDSGSHTIDVYYLTWPRGGCHLVWSAVDLYDILGMTAYKGERSKWVYGCWARWTELVQTISFGEHFFKSVKCVNADEGLTSEHFFLPVSCMTTFALVIMLTIWSQAPVAKGGLRDGSCKTQARAMLRALVQGTCVVPSSFELQFLAVYELRWPRPAMESPTKQTLMLQPGGMLDCSNWARVCNSEAEPKTATEILQWQWYSLLRTPWTTTA